jgi:hypothetical protein
MRQRREQSCHPKHRPRACPRQLVEPILREEALRASASDLDQAQLAVSPGYTFLGLHRVFREIIVFLGVQAATYFHFEFIVRVVEICIHPRSNSFFPQSHRAWVPSRLVTTRMTSQPAFIRGMSEAGAISTDTRENVLALNSNYSYNAGNPSRTPSCRSSKSTPSFSSP